MHKNRRQIDKNLPLFLQLFGRFGEK